MSTILWADVTGFTGALASVPVAAQTIILDIVNGYFDVALFNGEDSLTLKMMRILLAAHIASSGSIVEGGSGGAGSVVSESGGDGLSVTYATATLVVASNQWSETPYGRQLSQMVRESPARAGIVL